MEDPKKQTASLRDPETYKAWKETFPSNMHQPVDEDYGDKFDKVFKHGKYKETHDEPNE